MQLRKLYDKYFLQKFHVWNHMISTFLPSNYMKALYEVHHDFLKSGNWFEKQSAASRNIPFFFRELEQKLNI